MRTRIDKRVRQLDVAGVCFVGILGSLLLWVAVVRALEESGGTSNNLLENPGFELSGNWLSWPEPWLSYSHADEKITVPTDSLKRSGVHSMRIAARQTAGDFQGVIQIVPVEEKKEYVFSAYLLSDRHAPFGGSGYVQLVVEWRDENGVEIGRTYGAQRDRNLSRTWWDQAILRGLEAPKGAMRAVVGVHVFEGDKGGKGAVFVDDVAFAEK